MEYNRYQYEDLLIRGEDQYANAKYGLILNQLKNKEPLDILNVGCGSGELSFLLAETGHQVLGIDPSPEYIALAEKNKDKSSTGLCLFQVSSLENFSGENLYDCVIAADVLEHIKDDRAAIVKLTQLVKPGGLMILTVPALPALFGYHDKLLGHFRRYTKRSLRALINGVELIKIKQLNYFGFGFIPVCIWYSKILKKPYPVAASKNKTAVITGQALRFMLFFERQLIFPLGTSLVCLAEKNKSKHL